jgi:hypothetical protein
VLFAAAISEFDKNIAEDSTTNSLTGSLNLFVYVATNQYFANTAIIVLLNKRDLFEEKIRKAGYLAQYFDGYKGDNDLESAIQFMESKFLGKLPEEYRKKVSNIHDLCDRQRQRSTGFQKDSSPLSKRSRLVMLHVSGNEQDNSDYKPLLKLSFEFFGSPISTTRRA